MIPQFPEFKRIELSHKEEVEAFTENFPLYSDFNFISMWSWDVKGDVRVSQLNGNLVVRFNDYLTGEPFYSFIGENMVNETALALVGVANVLGVGAKLKLIPEEVAKKLNPEAFLIKEDRDNFDYICHIHELKSYDGSKFKAKRNEIKQISSNPAIVAKEIDLRNPDMRKDITNLFHKWVDNKIGDGKEFEENEELAFNKLLFLSGSYKLICVGVFNEEELIAFMISEPASSEYAMGHASKADTTIKGANAYLMKANSEILANYGCKYFNYEQDLGLQNLRDGKTRFNPAFFLKKYIVEEL